MSSDNSQFSTPTILKREGTGTVMTTSAIRKLDTSTIKKISPSVFSAKDSLARSVTANASSSVYRKNISVSLTTLQTFIVNTMQITHTTGKSGISDVPTHMETTQSKWSVQINTREPHSSVTISKEDTLTNAEPSTSVVTKKMEKSPSSEPSLIPRRTQSLKSSEYSSHKALTSTVTISTTKEGIPYKWKTR